MILGSTGNHCELMHSHKRNWFCLESHIVIVVCMADNNELKKIYLVSFKWTLQHIQPKIENFQVSSNSLQPDSDQEPLDKPYTTLLKKNS